MPCIVTSIHDPIALAATCRCFGLRRPEEGCLQLADQEASGWIVRLSGLHAPLVFNTLTGLVAYHPRDNAFGPYARVMRFILRYYDVRAKLRRGHIVAARRYDAQQLRCRLPIREVA